MKNDYYFIAMEELKYAEANFNTDFYNFVSINAQQVVEKLLKSVLEQLAPMTETGVNNIMHGHNLRAIYDKILEYDTTIVLDRGDLSMLKDYYYDAKYPGDNFVTVTKEECAANIEIMYNVVEQVNRFRKANDLETVDFTRHELQSMNYF